MQNENTPKVLGILGGLGPMASVYFYELITKHTDAKTDQDHIDIIINSRATTPDRSSFIMGKSNENPFDIMEQDAKRLVVYGAQAIAIPCNTAHYFYEKLDECIDIPILNMVEQTALAAKAKGGKTGIFATEGTVQSRTYQRICEKIGVEYEVPNEKYQQYIMQIIFNCVKQGKPADMRLFNEAVSYMQSKNCTSVILGCTELSIVKRDEKLSNYFIDSMEVLAKNTIELFGKTPIGL